MKELDRISQGYKDIVKDTDTVTFMTREEVKKIPKYKTVTYAWITANYREEKANPYQIRITVGRNLIKYSGLITLTTADLITSKIL